jgi:hypothetical protein
VRGTLEVVATKEFAATGTVVVGVTGRSDRCARAGRLVVDVTVVVVVVVVVATNVVTGDVEEGGRDEAAGTCGVVAEVRVKTRTSRRIGLDHIKRWALFREKCVRAIVFEG